MLCIGYWASSRSHSGTDFFLGGRNLGPWVAAISSSASSSSAWTLLGVSGAAFKYGLSAVYIFPACLLGFILNGYFLAKPIRELSSSQQSVTMTELLSAEAPSKYKKLITLLASMIILLSLSIYVASQFQAAGKTFEEILQIDFFKAVLVGGGIVFLYTVSGGFWAASISDLIQGLVMALAAIIVPLVALVEVGGFEKMLQSLVMIDPALTDLTRGKSGLLLVSFVVGTLGIGLGYPGQPHVINRYMALRSSKDARVVANISVGWALIIYAGMLIAGWCGRVLIDALGDEESVLLQLTTDLFPPVASGIIIAAILSAIMSTADSQLLVCASTVSHDVAGNKSTSVFYHRGAILIISAFAIFAAVKIDKTIFDQVLFAWSALGASFGPLLLCRIFRGPVKPVSSLLSMLLGFSVTLIWFFTPMFKGIIYELIPAFLAALIPAWVGSRR